MTYTSAAGKDSYHISLRDCHLILCMDNLVRLTFRDDPSPHESRSCQVCTLPITLKGVPKDEVEVEAWHDATSCDGTERCKCMVSCELSKDDVDKVLIEKSEAEMNALLRFRQLCTWNLSTIWNDIYQGD